MSKITTYMDDRNNNRQSAGAPKAGGGPQNSRFLGRNIFRVRQTI
jgi:hypothetical protein